ncbi:MAG TPA: hypothetical protein VJR23_00805 [Candidatus Acidoferrales bacterium]|nr:hypothetical protein [Candidatus Acidoferrales bacterium]
MALSSILAAVVAIPREVIWPYAVSALVILAGVGAIALRGEWSKARGIEKLILLGPIFYAAPVAAFGTEHYVISGEISTMVPQWIPWHLFWTYLIGTGFILGALSLVTKIQSRLTASLFGFTFLVFVTTMDIPGLLSNPHNRFSAALALRELSFGAGPLALAATFTKQWRERGTHFLATFARYCIAVTVLFYSFEQFLHADHVPALPLEMLTPAWIPAHTFWTYLTAAAFVPTGIMLLLGKKTRLAAALIGLAILLVELIVYVPIGVSERAVLEGLNYLYDTLMFCGAVLLLASAMPKTAREAESQLLVAEGKATA